MTSETKNRKKQLRDSNETQLDIHHLPQQPQDLQLESKPINDNDNNNNRLGTKFFVTLGSDTRERARNRMGDVKEGYSTLKSAAVENCTENVLPSNDMWRDATRADDFRDAYRATKSDTRNIRNELFPPRDDEDHVRSLR